jgi:photosystem II stability/assembly factor-like uncharacterized protein
LPKDWVTSVAIDRRYPSKVAFASFSGFRSGKQRSLVYRTTDGGKTWKDISGNLPQAPVNDVVPVGDDLLVATDVGVFLSRSVSTGLGRQWLKVGTGLPNAPITELRWHAPSSTLFAANFGRGAFSVKLPGLGARPVDKDVTMSASATASGTGSAPSAAPAPASRRAVDASPAAVAARPAAQTGSLPSPAVPVAVGLLLALVAGLRRSAQRHGAVRRTRS